jgi:hypothetical protein
MSFARITLAISVFVAGAAALQLAVHARSLTLAIFVAECGVFVLGLVGLVVVENKKALAVVASTIAFVAAMFTLFGNMSLPGPVV